MHPENQGAEGVVTYLGYIPAFSITPSGLITSFDADCMVYFDRPLLATIKGVRRRDCACVTGHLEPILDQHQPCEDDFKRDLDRMLDKEEVR